MASCQRVEREFPQHNGELSLRFEIDDMSSVQTKAVDPDGLGIQKVTLYCFDAYGLFIATSTIKTSDFMPEHQNPSQGGLFKITVPPHTEIVHIVCNQNIQNFSESYFHNKSEYEVMSELEASAGRMIYWARHTMDELNEIDAQGGVVKLLRNQAKITVEVKDNVPFDIEGFIVTHTSAFGTVAPYKLETAEFIAPSLADPFVTIPEDNVLLSDFQDVRGMIEEYVFESANAIDNPVNVIVKGSYNGGPSLYYRVIIMDDDGYQLPLLRNYHYRVIIADELSYGQTNFESSLTAAATNNVWITIEDHIPEVHGLTHVLKVDETNVVIDESQFISPNIYQLYYTIRRVDGASLTEADKPSVEWQEGNNVAYNAFSHEFNTATGRGTLTVTLHALGNLDKRIGTLMIKIGRIYRKIKVTTIKKQSFTPAWASTQVYGHETGEHMTMMFTIPDDCPEELFPMEVLVSTNILDIRHSSGQELPIRFSDSEEYYGEPNEWGYKYVYTIESPGKQRLYLENVLAQSGGLSLIRVETPHFTPMEKYFSFSDEVVNRAIIVHGLQSYSAVIPADDPIYYYYVPQKVNAHMEISTHVGELYDDPASGPDGTVISGGETKYVKYIAAGESDEFLFYSKYLSHEEKEHECDFNFYPYHESEWGSGGRVYGYMKNDKGYSGAGTGDNYGAHFHMLTNASRTEEVVRLASNPNGQESVTGVGLCQGKMYRSMIFELANYHPFSFAAQISYDAGEMTGTVVGDGGAEVEDLLTWSFVPGKAVNIAFDITSFKGVDGKSADPFGTPFEIYIDAPMLELGNIPAAMEGKIRKDSKVEGRFVYSVDASREQERNYGAASAYLTDATGLANQNGERKVIPFRVKDIVSAGTIRISSQEERVVFNPKSFEIQNESITGRLKYKNGSVNDVPHEAFVVLESMKTYNRIGTVTVAAPNAQGHNMDIRLRSEYRYNWFTDPVKIQYAKSDGFTSIIYEKVFASLDELYQAAASGDILLERVEEE